jgi:hypothetical protein
MLSEDKQNVNQILAYSFEGEDHVGNEIRKSNWEFFSLSKQVNHHLFELMRRSNRIRPKQQQQQQRQRPAECVCVCLVCNNNHNIKFARPRTSRLN